jgi:monoamine oxidase
MRAFADQAGVRCRSANPLPELAGFDCGEGRRLSAAEVGESLSLQLEDFPQARGRLLAELGPDASAAAGIEAFVAGSGLAPGPARRARQALRALVEGESADLAERQSLRWMWNEMEYQGHYFGDAPEGGYRRLAEAMAVGVDLRLGVEVAEIACSAGGVRVRGADGTSEDGSHVVVTVPRTAGLPHAMIFPRDSGAPAVWAIGLDAFGAGPVLIFQIFHSAARHVLGTAPDDAARWVLDLLADAIGRSCPAPAAVAVTSWANDRYSGGAYTHIPPGANPADADVLGEPIGGRLLFAGEHTQSTRLAYADGAMTSGIREAKRLLGQPSVRLGPISPRRA